MATKKTKNRTQFRIEVHFQSGTPGEYLRATFGRSEITPALRKYIAAALAAGKVRGSLYSGDKHYFEGGVKVPAALKNALA